MRVWRGRTAALVAGGLLSSVLLLLVITTPTQRRATTAALTDRAAVMQQRQQLLRSGCSSPRSVSSDDKHRQQQPEDALTMRAARANDAAQGYEELSRNIDMVNHLIVDEVHKALYCYVPKVACTNWKRLMAVLSSATNATDPLLIPADSVHRPHALTRLDSFQPDEIIHRLKTYTKFLFVRDPLERVLSAFRNKFEMNYASSAYFKKRFGVRIQRMFRHDDSVSPIGDGTTFPEFVRYFVLTVQQRPGALNEHWAPVVQLCQPCLVRYDYIGKYESLAEDSASILSYLGAPAHLKIPDAKSSLTGSLLPEYMAELTPTQRQQLQLVFADDIFLFGYAYRDMKHTKVKN